MTKNQIDYQSFLESARHNATSEAEVLRHNTVTEAQTGGAQALEAERNRISKYQAETQRYSAENSVALGKAQAQAAMAQAQASSAQAGAAQLNALTNQRKQDLEEQKWTNPFGGQATGNAVGLVKTGIDAVTGFARFLTILKG